MSLKKLNKRDDWRVKKNLRQDGDLTTVLVSVHCLRPHETTHPECIGEETRLTLSSASGVQLYLLRESLSRSFATAKCCRGHGRVMATHKSGVCI